MSRIYVALDLETTGLHPERDAIIEIGAIKFRLGGSATEDPVLDTWSTFVNPGRPIPYRISRLTGIQQEDVQQAPRLATAGEALAAFVGNYPVIGHNIAFDLNFLHRHNILVGNASLDTFELASILLPDAPRYSLDQLAAYLGLTLKNHHRALADAIAAQQLLTRLWERACALPHATITAINRVAGNSPWSLRSFFAAVGRAQETAPPAEQSEEKNIPSDGSPAAAAAGGPPQPGGRAIGAGATTLPPLELILAEDGPFAQILSPFSPRPQQIEMLQAVWQAFSQQEHLLVEAGTGTGKSLAYLIPATLQALATNQPVVISTNTINLQDQLFLRDLPLLRHALGLDKTLQVTLLKGRTNYLCRRRLTLFMRRPAFSEVEARAIARILVWHPSTQTGDRSEIAVQSDEDVVWEHLCADASTCRPDLCETFGGCFFHKARATAQNSHLLIINHALLLTDMAAPSAGILPPYKHLIIDEAHHLEERATEQFGQNVSCQHFQALLAELHLEQGRRPTGLLPTIATQREKSRAPNAVEARRLAGQLGRQVAQVRLAFQELLELIPEALEPWTTSRGDEFDYQTRLKPEVRLSGGWRRVIQAAQLVITDSDQLLNSLTDLETLLRAEHPTGSETLEHLSHLRRTIGEQMAALWRIVAEPQANDICWVTRFHRGDDLVIHHAPLTVSSLLSEHLFAARQSAVLTSATLQSESSFEYVRDRLGVPSTCRELGLGAPFNYRQMAMVYVPTDIPEPNSPNYSQPLHRALIDLARATRGRMLVLLTSKSQLRGVYRAISDPLVNDGILVFAQYMDGGRRQLLERFKTTERAVLLGTQSFWEGVDVPGPALSCLVIARLPFPVPSEPIFAARAESYDDHFNQFVIPQTVLRFRQGFGRLIRTEDDRGIVALLDSRVFTKSYGAAFLNSLPATDIRHGPFRDLPPLAERWLAGDTANIHQNDFSPDFRHPHP